MRGDGIGYIKIAQFGQDTRGLVDDALADLKSKNPKGVIIDVRDDPGGYLDVAVDVTSRFVADRGAIVKEEDKAGRIEELKATSQATFTDVPLMVLVNGGSASASEIFAGALQDYGRAKLIGEKTFGKGSVQELEPIVGGGAVRITVAKWLTPKNRQISKVGIAPDIEVKLTEDDYKNNKDPQLDRAVAELLK
jgi:carboxyl-terminal processing protease